MTTETISQSDVGDLDSALAPAPPPKKYYSAKVGGFFAEDIHGSNIPADCVEISQATWGALLDAQSAGKQIVADATGHPIAADPVASLVMKQAALKAHMATIESGQNRALRETALGMVGAADRLRGIDQQIAELRAQLAALS